MIDDHTLVTGLCHGGLRELLMTATGLSTEALLRIAAAAEALRQTEGLQAAPRTAQL